VKPKSKGHPKLINVIDDFQSSSNGEVLQYFKHSSGKALKGTQ
jgi:hypothetical protein